MSEQFYAQLRGQLDGLKSAGLFKAERVITSPQGSRITCNDRQVLNFCANNYLGLASHPELVESARAALTRYGYGLSSVRFICGTQDVHKELEMRLSRFLGMEDTILYSSCFDANGGLFEALLEENDVIISDELNHASIIDGIRLAKAKRLRYRNSDMNDLEAKLKEAAGARHKLIATDGIFSMDGTIANLRAICDLAERYGALVMVDDSHAVGFMGAGGRGTHEHCGVMGRVAIITGTLGKALGGAAGGYVSARREVVTWLRQKSRPYLFSNSLTPLIAATSLKVLDLLERDDTLRSRLHRNARLFRKGMVDAGLKLVDGEHPIIPVMTFDAPLAGRMAEMLLGEGIYVIGFSYPVVPQGKARIRTQMSAAHSEEEIQRAVAAFTKVGIQLGLSAPER